MKRQAFFTLLTILCAAAPCAFSGEPAANKRSTDQKQDSPPGDEAARFKAFEKTLFGSTLVGHFTVLGQEAKELKQERYTINSVTKADAGDYWIFNVRIKYGDRDVTLPMPLEVKWADDTPVITLSNLVIPGLGTFSARVIIYNDKYAGTWTHGAAGGHLFGVIQKKTVQKKKSDKNEKSDDSPANK